MLHIRVVVLPHGQRVARLVIGEIQRILEGSGGGVGDSFPDYSSVLGYVFMLQTVRDLDRPDAGHVVFVGIGAAAYSQAAESAALGPGEIGIDRLVEPVARVARGGIGDVVVIPVQGDSGQQVSPGRIAVVIGNGVSAAADRADIARRINGIIDDGGSRRSGGIVVPGLLCQLILRILFVQRFH